MPTPRPTKYDEAAHAERIRAVLRKRLDALPLRALVKLQEVAAALEAGGSLKLLLARETLGKRRGRIQVQQREDVDRGQRDLAATSVENAELEEAERVVIREEVAARRRRLGKT